MSSSTPLEVSQMPFKLYDTSNINIRATPRHVGTRNDRRHHDIAAQLSGAGNDGGVGERVAFPFEIREILFCCP